MTSGASTGARHAAPPCSAGQHRQRHRQRHGRRQRGWHGQRRGPHDPGVLRIIDGSAVAHWWNCTPTRPLCASRAPRSAPFVYFGLHFKAIDSEPHLRPMVAYVMGVLSALGIENVRETRATPRTPHASTTRTTTRVSRAWRCSLSVRRYRPFRDDWRDARACAGDAPSSPRLSSLAERAMRVLVCVCAFIPQGAIHSEVKLEERGPVLIEANCRLHGGEGTWAPMAEACVGYSQVSGMID
eukprot:4994720-Prymnesium_polylepis.2